MGHTKKKKLKIKNKIKNLKNLNNLGINYPVEQTTEHSTKSISLFL